MSRLHWLKICAVVGEITIAPCHVVTAWVNRLLIRLFRFIFMINNYALFQRMTTSLLKKNIAVKKNVKKMATFVPLDRYLGEMITNHIFHLLTSVSIAA